MRIKKEIRLYFNLLLVWILFLGTIADSMNLGDLLIANGQNLKFADTEFNSAGSRPFNADQQLLTISSQTLRASIPYFDEDSPSEEASIEKTYLGSSFAEGESFIHHSRSEISEELFIINRALLI